jgi:hypothetical protein
MSLETPQEASQMGTLHLQVGEHVRAAIMLTAEAY